MRFGSTDHPGEVDLSLPEDHPETKEVLKQKGDTDNLQLYVGCSKWNSEDLSNFYPKGTSDELKYYGKQFNGIELNATFYNTFGEEQVSRWRSKVPDNFKFFPKVNRYISHLKWLNNIESSTDKFIDSVVHFREKLGTIFLQLRAKFRPKFFGRVQHFVEYWPDGIPLAIELRHPDWFSEEVAGEVYTLFEEHDITNIITDTAGRRDLLHMRMTSNEAFIRYVGANHPTDISRLDGWAERLKHWKKQGLKHIYFFVHQNEERKSPQLAAHFIQKMNETAGTDVKVPEIAKKEINFDI